MRGGTRPLALLAISGVIIALSGTTFAQGLVTFINNTATLIRTNSIGLGGTAGVTTASLDSFVYGLFIADPSVTNVAPQDLLSTSWTFTGLYATNTGAPGRLGGGDPVTVFGWDDTTNSFAVAGWSANVAGMDWSSVGFQLAGGSLNNGVWTGPDWLPASDGGFFGVSALGHGVAPDPIHARPGLPIFGTVPFDLGVPISTGFDMYVIHVPEPPTFALALAGTLAVLIARSRRMVPRSRIQNGICRDRPRP